MVDQALRQVAAAGDTPIRWVFAEPDVAMVMRNMFAEYPELSGIEILVIPPK